MTQALVDGILLCLSQHRELSTHRLARILNTDQPSLKALLRKIERTDTIIHTTRSGNMYWRLANADTL